MDQNYKYNTVGKKKTRNNYALFRIIGKQLLLKSAP